MNKLKERIGELQERQLNESQNRTYKVVVTGFGPFRDVVVNESWQAASGLWEMEWPSQIKLVTRELPVVFDVVHEQVNKLWDEEKPDLIIHVGVSMESNAICIERQSFNDEYYHADIINKCPANECCVPNGEQTLKTKLNVDQLCQVSNATFAREQSKATCEPSEDPGRYLCGYSYYLSLSKDCAKSLFVHVPGKDCISIKEDSLALRAIIFEALDQLYGFKA